MKIKLKKLFEQEIKDSDFSNSVMFVFGRLYYSFYFEVDTELTESFGIYSFNPSDTDNYSLYPCSFVLNCTYFI